MISGRYRIVSMLGRGGMGEVYRAEDLRLGQAVALKFLPAATRHHARLGERLVNEVRVARTIVHPNVCRMYDVGEAEGRVFVTMEYVDGEDLASLVRRIGRLPRDKAADVGRQICAGLDAVHRSGILHRDLKPANVMIDGRGQVRLLDFGLAAAAADVQGTDVLAGTPGFMAPEQLAGREVTVKSDVYALGIVLSVVFTGRPPFDEIVPSDPRHTARVVPPSRHLADIDPAVERTILRCLDPDPLRRPLSAAAIAAALPGGDPIAAALAAGETPSPELVAAAESRTALSPRAAGGVLILVLAAALGAAFVSSRTGLGALAPGIAAPEALQSQAQGHLRALGHETDGLARASGFFLEEARRGEREPRLGFWFRQSPRTLAPLVSRRIWSDEEDPPPVPGSARVRLGSDGELQHLEVVSTQAFEEAPPNWSAAFHAARLDPADWSDAEVDFAPPVFADRRAAWRSNHATIRAAACGGRVVFWDRSAARPAGGVESGRLGRLSEALHWPIWVIGLTGGVLLARANLRRRRGHRAGALRLAFVVFAARMLTWAFGAPHVARPGMAGLFQREGELGALIDNIAESLLVSGTVWLLYLALEPYVRRQWPERIVGWIRLIEGRFRDPIVGTEILVGAAAGAFAGLALPCIGAWLNDLVAAVSVPDGILAVRLIGLRGGRYATSLLFEAVPMSLYYGLFGSVLLLVARRLVRRDLPGVLLTWAVMTLFLVSAVPSRGGGSLLLAGTLVAVCLGSLVGVGMLAMITCIFCWRVLAHTPFFGADWAAEESLLALATIAAIGVWGFTALARKRPRLAGA